MNTANSVARTRDTITVVLKLNSEQSARAKGMVSHATTLKQNELNDTFAGNVLGYRSSDYVAQYGSIWYKQGTLKYVGPRDGIANFDLALEEIFVDFFYWPHDACDLEVVTYGASDKKLKWYETYDAGYARLLKKGVVTAQGLYNQAKFWDDVPMHYLKIIAAWAQTLPYMPKAGTPAYAQAAAGGMLSDFKYYDQVRAWVKKHMG